LGLPIRQSRLLIQHVREGNFTKERPRRKPVSLSGGSDMKKLPVAILAGVLVFGGAGAAFADPPHCPPGHAKKGECGWRDNSRDERRAYEQGYRDAQRDAWRRGEYLRGDDVRYVVIRETDYGRYNLHAPPRGQYYAQVDGQILLVQAATQLILQAMSGY